MLIQAVSTIVKPNYAKAGYLSGKRNDNFYNYTTDCANFVSQCLFAGGLKMNWQWHSRRYDKDHGWTLWNNDKYDWVVSEPWRLAAAQFEFFVNPYNGYSNGPHLTIWTKEGVKDVAKCGVKKDKMEKYIMQLIPAKDLMSRYQNI